MHQLTSVSSRYKQIKQVKMKVNCTLNLHTVSNSEQTEPIEKYLNQSLQLEARACQRWLILRHTVVIGHIQLDLVGDKNDIFSNFYTYRQH